MQAVVVAPLFKRTVIGWAHASGALMQCTANAQSGGVEEHGTVDWSNLIKSSKDAVHKVSEQYGGDPQYLVDIVRHRIIFDSVDAQYRCLATICEDPHIVVVYIDNGQQCIKQNVPSHIQGTFEKPSVRVYFTLTTSEAFERGVSGHVLELELVLREIWKLFNDDAHYAYVAYRRALLSEQSVPARALRRLLTLAVQGRRGRARVDTLHVDSPLEHLEAGMVRSEQSSRCVLQSSRPLLVAFGSSASIRRVRSRRQTDSNDYSATLLEDGVNGNTGGELTHVDIHTYFQISTQHVKECFEIGKCQEKQGIPPALLARLGYDGLFLFDPCSISGLAKENWRLQQILDVLCLPPTAACNQAILCQAPDPLPMEEAGELEELEACVMSPEMRDVLRQKCLERGNAKAHSLFEVCVRVFCLMYLVHTQTHKHIHKHTQTHTHTHAHTRTLSHLYTHMHTHAYTHTHTHTLTHKLAQTYAHTHTHTHIHINLHKHT